jgi:hypothetical protein
MTRRSLNRWIWLTIVVYLSVIAIGVALRTLLPGRGDAVYATFKDLVPLAVAIPAAWLAYCFQRRSSYMQQLRVLWSKLTLAVQDAIQYTHLTNPSQDQFAAVMKSLNIAIDEVRALFSNLDESRDAPGLFPFKSVKDIRTAIRELGFGSEIQRDRASATRELIGAKWEKTRSAMLQEFDRSAPTFPDTSFAAEGDIEVHKLKAAAK